MDPRKFAAMPLPLLQGLCRAQGKPTTGTKDALVERLSVQTKKKASSGIVDESRQSDKRSAVDEAPTVVAPLQVLDAGLIQVNEAAVTVMARTGCKRRREEKTEGVVDLPANFARPDLGSEFRLLWCSHCGALFDLQKSRYTEDVSEFWCPRCRFQVMDPLRELVEDNGFLHCELVTSSTVQISVKIPKLEEVRKQGQIIEIRMLCVNSNKVRHLWPHEMSCKINGLQAFQVGPPKKGHKRRDIPEDVTPGLRVGKNTIVLSILDSSRLMTDYAVALVLVQPRSIKYLRSQVTRCEEHSARKRVAELIGKHADGSAVGDGVEQLASSTLRLVCPISFDRILVPVRGEMCKHLQCFDLQAYCRCNARIAAFNNRWACPVCNATLRPSDLRIDAYVERVLAETRNLDVEGVHITEDGSWSISTGSNHEETP